jgi:hypothetical protein
MVFECKDCRHAIPADQDCSVIEQCPVCKAMYFCKDGLALQISGKKYLKKLTPDDVLKAITAYQEGQ